MIKALFFDIDGTLVSFHTHRIPRSTVESLEKAKKKGLKIFISTGRPLTYINNLDDIKSLIDGYITTNGAYILVGDKVIACHTIPKEDVCAMMKFSDERKFPCILVGESAALVYNTTREIEEFFHRLLDLNNISGNISLSALLQQRIIQMTPIITAEEEAEIMPCLPSCESSRWYPAFADVTAKGVDKGKGVKSVAKYCGFSISEVMAFGDGGNDTNMLKVAGIGVAMGNAGNSLKKGSRLCDNFCRRRWYKTSFGVFSCNIKTARFYIIGRFSIYDRLFLRYYHTKLSDRGLLVSVYLFDGF